MGYQFQMYPQIQPAPRHLNPAGPAWHPIEASQPIAAAPPTSQQHIIQRLPPPPPPPGQPQPHDQTFREGPWEGYHTSEDISAQPGSYDYRYRDENGWVPPDSYYGAAVRSIYPRPICTHSPVVLRSMIITMGMHHISMTNRTIHLLQILLRDKRLYLYLVLLIRQRFWNQRDPVDANAPALKLVICSFHEFLVNHGYM